MEIIMRKYSFTLSEKFHFYLSYLFYKLIIPFEVKEGRSSLVITEAIWVLSKIFKFNPILPKKVARNYFETKFGKFFINPDLISTIAVSPSFERNEINYLLKIIEKDLRRKNKILFVDVGAFFGLYSVIVGNKFKKNKNIQILTFEPDTNYLSNPTFKLLKKNIQKNKLKNVRIFHIGLGAINNNKPNKIGVKTKKLDSLISKDFVSKFDSIYMKIDVDGYEKGVLEGGKDFIRNSNNLTLLIEDFVDNEIVTYLKKDFQFISKPSEYNSIWRKK